MKRLLIATSFVALLLVSGWAFVNSRHMGWTMESVFSLVGLGTCFFAVISYSSWRSSLAVVSVLFIGSAAAAQTCTPVRIGKDSVPPLSNYNETTPAMNFVVNSTTYQQKATINFPPITQISASPNYGGYVNVRPGYGGCLASWDIEGFGYYIGLYDLTTGHWVYDSPVISISKSLTCGRVASCGYYLPGDYYTIGVIPGHSYLLWGFIEVNTSVGNTAWEDDYVTINIQ